MIRFALALLSGLVFGCGILLSGMANPAKILNFFDLAGSWDPSLAFVMGGALTVTAIGYRLIGKLERPMTGEIFRIPADRPIDARLVLGAATFGVGWGIAGFCPGGAIPALGFMRADVSLFVVAMVAGIVAVRAIDPVAARLKRASQAQHNPTPAASSAPEMGNSHV